MAGVMGKLYNDCNFLSQRLRDTEGVRGGGKRGMGGGDGKRRGD